MAEVPEPGLEYHWWVVDHDDWSKNAALCIKAGDNTIPEIKARHPQRRIGITTSRATFEAQGCPECLALLHA